MTAIVEFQQLAQSLGQVRTLLAKADDQVQQGLRVDPHNKFLCDLEDFLSNKILEANHAIKIAYDRGTFLGSDESAAGDQPSLESSAGREGALPSAA
jgi:hypothetical protein